MSMLNKDAFKTWEEVETELFSPTEIAESDLRVALIGEVIKARNEKGLSQRELAALCGVRQPIISRMESFTAIPNLSTLLKVLVPLGKTLYVGDLDLGEFEESLAEDNAN